MKTLALLALALFLPALPAAAHGTIMAGYGGQTAETPEGWRIEFAVRDGGVRAWVRDHEDKPVAASGKATLLAGGRKLDVALAVDGDMLTAEAPVAAADKVTAVLALVVAGKPVSARFAQDGLVTPALAGPALAGRTPFQQICSVCHGPALRGSDKGPPLLHALDQPGSAHGDDAILAAATTGAKSHMWKFGDMPKPEGLKPGQEKDVLAYIRAMQAANGFVGTPGAPPAAMPMGHEHMNHTKSE